MLEAEASASSHRTTRRKRAHCASLQDGHLAGAHAARVRSATDPHRNLSHASPWSRLTDARISPASGSRQLPRFIQPPIGSRGRRIPTSRARVHLHRGRHQGEHPELFGTQVKSAHLFGSSAARHRDRRRADDLLESVIAACASCATARCRCCGSNEHAPACSHLAENFEVDDDAYPATSDRQASPTGSTAALIALL